MFFGTRHSDIAFICKEALSASILLLMSVICPALSMSENSCSLRVYLPHGNIPIFFSKPAKRKNKSSEKSKNKN